MTSRIVQYFANILKYSLILFTQILYYIIKFCKLQIKQKKLSVASEFFLMTMRLAVKHLKKVKNVRWE